MFQGKYECVATNTVGTEYSYSAQLYVRGNNFLFSSITFFVFIFIHFYFYLVRSGRYTREIRDSVRRVPPHFTIRPELKYDVKNGEDINITCVAVGSPMPFVKWREGVKDLTPDNAVPIGKNVLLLHNIRQTSTYTCVAASKLGIIETHTVVKVQCKYFL